MFNNRQFREKIIAPALNDLCLYSEDAEELLVATMAHESQGGTFVAQTQGPALGVYQMERITYEDLWQRYISHDASLARLILNGCRYLQIPPADHLVWNLKLATMTARIYYKKVNESLPKKDDLLGIWQYYKTYWNTALGSAKEEDFIKNYNKFTGKKGT